MHDEVDGHPVVDGVSGVQQHEAHAHVVVGPHFQEPVNPVEDVLPTWTQFSSDRSLHSRLCCDAQGDGEEREVVARVQSVPVSTDEHGPASPERYRHRREAHQTRGEFLSSVVRGVKPPLSRLTMLSAKKRRIVKGLTRTFT